MDDQARNPRYLRPFFGATPVVPAPARRVLALVALGLFFENYDLGLINAALPQVSADLEIPAEDTGFYLGVIRLGGLGTFLLLPLADRLGRKRVFIAAFVGMSLGTLATAVCQTPVQFAAAQFVARVFLLVAAALALVILVEEFPAEQRGAGLGLLTLLGGMGYGLCAGLYAIVDVLPFGWRALYGIGVVPLLLLPFFGRSLTETRRFETHLAEQRGDAGQVGLAGWVAPMLALLRSHPRRVAAVGAAAFLAAAGGIGFFQYTSWFVQEVHGWSPAGYSGLVILGGSIGILGSILGGRGSDRFGRRLVGLIGFALAPLFGLAFFTGPSSWLIVTWGLFVFCSSAGDLVLRALSAELFPTSQRSTSTGWLMLVQTLGWTLGLVVMGIASTSSEDLPRVITAVTMVMAGGAVALLLVPETHGRELEAISGDPPSARPG